MAKRNCHSPALKVICRLSPIHLMVGMLLVPVVVEMRQFECGKLPPVGKSLIFKQE